MVVRVHGVDVVWVRFPAARPKKIMSDLNLKKLITEYLAEGKVMQLATVNNGQPWICTVNYVYDDKFNVYWMSLKTRRHSQELRNHSQAAGAIVKDPNVKRCLHFTGIAKELSGADLEIAHKLYSEIYGDKPQRLAEAQSPDPDTRTYYVLEPNYIVLFDEVNFPDNPRQEYYV